MGMGNRIALAWAVVFAAGLVTTTTRAESPSPLTAPPPAYADPAPAPPADVPIVYAQPQPQPFVAPTSGPRRAQSPAATGGLGIFGGMYAWSFMSGMFAIIIGEGGSRCDRCTPYGRWLFLPAVGPFVSMARESETRQGRIYAGILGSGQVFGLLVYAIGALTEGPRSQAPLPPGPGFSFGIRPDGMDVTLRF